MNKRDLKADLELCNGFAEMLGEETLEDAITKAMGQSFSEFKKDTFATHALTGWPHAIKRAMEAEVLNRELIEAIEVIVYYKNRGCKCGPSITCEMCDNYRSALETVEKAKEVSEDGTYCGYEKPIHDKCPQRAITEKERVDKLEALARELADTMKVMLPRHLTGRLDLDLDMVYEAKRLISKAEEVLGDE